MALDDFKEDVSKTTDPEDSDSNAGSTTITDDTESSSGNGNDNDSSNNDGSSNRDSTVDDNTNKDTNTADSPSNSDTDGSNGNTHLEDKLEQPISTPSRGGNNEEHGKDEKDNGVFGIEQEEWNRMSKKEIVAEIRESKIPDFRPDLQLDERWSYNPVIELECVCGNTFYFATKGLCFECGRSYSREKRTVVKISDPEGVKIHEPE